MKRYIPILLIDDGRLVKTKKFGSDVYVGDPINTIRLFNEKSCDELIVLDIGCSRRNQKANLELIEEISKECFMPLCYGGGVNSIAIAKQIYETGVEKIAINSALQTNLINEISTLFGSQAIVASIDVRRQGENLTAYVQAGKRNIGDAYTAAATAVKIGAGELLLNFIDHEGTQIGYDFVCTSEFVNQFDVPVIVNGGARSIADLDLVLDAGASAAGAGSLFIFVGRNNAVLVNYPSEEIREL